MNEEPTYDRSLCQTCFWHRCAECWNNPHNNKAATDSRGAASVPWAARTALPIVHAKEETAQ